MLLLFKNVDLDVNVIQTVISPFAVQRRNPNRRPIDGVIPSKSDFDDGPTGNTPKKQKKECDDGTAPTPIRQRWQECTGKLYHWYMFKTSRNGRKERLRHSFYIQNKLLLLRMINYH
mmetsp:Transcript_13443/g.16306  ORF Transcript_13443/g.16306 Transcript_13443/m.16306 type:complete len:117 (-) Transcript_13443:173-523(-)